MTWTPVPKPSTTAYTAVNAIGKQSYDEASLTYDSSSTYYDGVNQGLWTSVAKPSTSSWTSVAKPT